MLDDYFVDGFDKDYNKLDEDLEIDVGEFFRENLIKTRGIVSDKSFRRFVVLDDDGERVNFILGLAPAHELPVEVENYERKDAAKTKRLKEDGNTAFGFNHYEVAIVEYNNAALVAPKDELGVILANRSAAFYHLERYQLALRDCDEALKIGYPSHLLYKLEERRARCLLALNAHTRAMEAFKSAIRALDDARMPPEKRKKFEADMRVMLAVMQKGEQLNLEKGFSKQKMLEIEDNKLKEKDPTPKIKDRNPVYPACSKAVDIKDAGGSVGRYAVATRDIQPGEILVVEKPHCASILGEYRLTHCHACSIRLGAPYPASCYTCSSVAYCSPSCRDADAQVHEVECETLAALWCSRASVTCVLALRAVAQRPYAELVKLLQAKKSRLEPNKERPYVGSDYRVFSSLVTHEDERNAEDLFHRAYIAAWLFRVLKTTSYFPDEVKTTDSHTVPLSAGEKLIAGAILHHIQLLQFNSHEISEFVKPKKKPDITGGKSLFVGGGVYPTVALFNHSCNPGVIRYFVGNTMIVRAIRTIPAGCEVSENYGPIFTEEEETDRKRKLCLQYWFDCNCEACKDHWPLLNDIPPNILRFKCETGPSCGNVLLVKTDTEEFMVRCPKCGKSTNILKGLKAMQDTDALYKTAKNHLDNNNHEEALKSYLEILKILDETLALPIKDYHICQQDIRKCMLALGNSSVI